MLPYDPLGVHPTVIWGSEMVSANRVGAAINPPIDDTDPIRNFSIDPGSHADWQNPAEFSPNGGRYGISVSTPHRRYGHRLRTPFLRTPFLRSEELQNESFPNFSIFRPEFCPEFCSEFSPKFLRSFRASFFCGRRRPEKIHQKSPPFFNAKFPGKFEEKIQKMFLESGQSNISERT